MTFGMKKDPKEFPLKKADFYEAIFGLVQK
jgi:hypothetical protein